VKRRREEEKKRRREEEKKRAPFFPLFLSSPLRTLCVLSASAVN